MTETPRSALPYEPPRIDRVLAADDLEPEIPYAGDAVSSSDEGSLPGRGRSDRVTTVVDAARRDA